MKLINKIIIFLITIILISFSICTNVSFAATTYKQTLKSGIKNFPEEYQEELEKIQNLHPDWTFEAYYTGLPWKTVVLNETTHGRNRVINSSDLSWKCSCGNVASGYACASEGIVEYYLDPRNFLNEVNIFQFLEISYNSKIHKLDGVKTAVKNTFLDNKVTYTLIEKVKDEEGKEKEEEKEYTKYYAEIILEAAEKSNMSPYSIVTKIIQEVGTKGSSSVSGTYEGYKGYYNFYNLGAYDTGNAIENGLRYARDKKWNNQYVAIIEGAQELANAYTNAGQNTAYFYKWDVVGTKILKSGQSQTISSSNMFWHQYMTNVQDPTSQSKSLYNTYAENKILDGALNFIIPVYEDMPDKIGMPTGFSKEDGDLYYVNCTDGLILRDSPTTSGKKLTLLYKNAVVLMLEKSCKEANGYTWDKVKLSNGLTGYVASKYLTLKSTATVKYYEYKNENIIILPGTTLDKIDKGATGELKTGAKLKVDGKEYIAVVLGDSNGDGKITSSDYVKVKNVIRGKEKNSDVEDAASDVTGDGKVTSSDYVKIKNVIRGKEKIKI